MQILHTAPPLDPTWGGPFWSVRGLAKAQVDLGLEVEVRMPHTDAAAEHLEAWRPATTVVDGEIRLRSLGWSPQFTTGVMNSSADLLHTHGVWLHPSWVARRWKRRLGRPHVLSTRGMLEPWAMIHPKWRKWPIWRLLEKSHLESASLLHATSNS